MLQIDVQYGFRTPAESLMTACLKFNREIHQFMLKVVLVAFVFWVFPLSSATNGLDVQQREESSEGLDSESIESLRAIAELKSKFERTREMYNVVHSLNLEEVVELIRLSESLPSSIQLDAHLILIERLTQLDPELALRSVQGEEDDNLISTIFEYWSRIDLDGSIEQLTKLEGLERFAGLRGLIVLRTDLSDDERVEIGDRLGESELVASMLAVLKEDEYLENPSQSWYDIIDQAREGKTNLDSLYPIASEWYEQSGLSVIHSIVESPISNELRNSIIAFVLGNATEREPRSTFELALELNGPPYNFDPITYQFTLDGIVLNGRRQTTRMLLKLYRI